MSKTALALNNLRGLVLIIVVAFHSFIAYRAIQPISPSPFGDPPYAWIANPIMDNHRWIGFDLFCAFQYLYLMHLMFFLSGLFVWPSLRRKGIARFLKDRIVRLGVPFVLVVGLLMPIAYYAVYLVSADDPSWSDFLSAWLRLPFWPDGPMWFVACLLAFDVLAALLYWAARRPVERAAQWAGRLGRNPARFVLWVVALAALLSAPLAAAFQPWDWIEFGPFALQPELTPQYLAYFLAGLAAGAFGLDRGLFEAEGRLTRHWAAWSGGALVCFAAWIFAAALINGRGEAVPAELRIYADLALLFFSASASFGLIALFLRFSVGNSPLFAGLGSRAYGIYLVHYVFVLWIQYGLLGLELSALAKGAIALAASLALSWAAVAALCRIPGGARVILGQRGPAAPFDPSAAAVSAMRR